MTTLHNSNPERRDAALNAVLNVIGYDIARGRNVRDLPPALMKTMRKVLRGIPVSLDEPLDGDIAI